MIEPANPLDPREATEKFQARGVRQGKQFDEQCRIVLEGLGFHVGDKPFRVKELGCEFDAEIRTRGGLTYWCEFKGSWHGKRPGMRRTDTAKKALVDVFLAFSAPQDYPQVIILTTHLPTIGSSGDRMIQVAKSCGALKDIFCVNDPADMGRLQSLAELPRPSLEGQERLFHEPTSQS